MIPVFRWHPLQLYCYLMVFNWLQAVATIDGEIGPQLSVRRKREGAGATFFDANMYPQGSMGVVPEALRPKPGHLSLSQQRVYEVICYLLLGKCFPWKNAMLFFSSYTPSYHVGFCSASLAKPIYPKFACSASCYYSFIW